MIDESKLDRLKLLANLAAALSLVIFIVLIGFSAFRLQQIRAQIRTHKEQLGEVQTAHAALTKKHAALTRQAGELELEIKALEERKRHAESVVDELCKVDPQTYVKALEDRAASSSLRAEKVAPLIYIHIADESQRPRAEALADALREGGYVVPDIENVSRKRGAEPPENTQLRLYPGLNEDKAKLLHILVTRGIKPELRTLRQVARLNQYELWFGTKDVASGSHPPP